MNGPRVACQKSKIHRHRKTPVGPFQPSARFQYVHLNIVGPLPLSNGFTYCLTMMTERPSVEENDQNTNHS